MNWGRDGVGGRDGARRGETEGLPVPVASNFWFEFESLRVCRSLCCNRMIGLEKSWDAHRFAKCHGYSTTL